MLRLVDHRAHVVSDDGAPTEAAVRDRLDALEQRASAGEFSRSTPLGGPVIYRYPAVMMPEFQRAVLDAIAPAGAGSMRTLDPFVGSGTTMCEASLRGFPFVGIDVNPLAILISRVKAGPFHLSAFRVAAHRVSLFARRSRSQSRVDFASRDKWYQHDVQLDLARLRKAIEAEGQPPTRRFLWVALAETARLCSNSRLTTVKLHIRRPKDLHRRLHPVDVFDQVVDANLAGLEAWCSNLASRELVRQGNWLRSEVRLLQGDVRSDDTFAAVPKARFGLVVTSPPYGDNRSTIPYGEASYLPTQWIDPEDLDLDAAPENAFVVDAASLGGSRAGAMTAAENLAGRSPSFACVAAALRSQPEDRIKRVASFTRDLDQAIANIHRRLEPGAWQLWTVGSRTVGGVRMPLAAVLAELQGERGVHHVATLTRPLPSQRRAAARNDRAPRMTEEQVVVLHNASR